MKALQSGYEIPTHPRYRILATRPLSGVHGRVVFATSGAYLVSLRFCHSVESVAGKQDTTI